MKKHQQNHYAFIDSQNLNLAILDQGWKLDFRKFRVYLREKYGVTNAFLFIGYIPENIELYQHLKESGFVIIHKPTLQINDGTVKGNVDAELVLHAMLEYGQYQKAVIVTGDGDFYCLVDYLNKKDKLLRLLIPNVRKYSKLLKPFAANRIDFMNNLKKKLEYKKQRTVKKPSKTAVNRAGSKSTEVKRARRHKKGTKKGRQLHKDQPL